MDETQREYQPKFPQAHGLLLNVYMNALKSTGDESFIWCERLKALTNGWEALKEDGMLPGLFTKTFWEDVQDVMGKVHNKIDLRKVNKQQALITFAIANLRRSFGAR